MTQKQKFVVWWTYVSNFGEPEIVEVEVDLDVEYMVKEAIEQYPTLYDKAKLNWFAFPLAEGYRGYGGQVCNGVYVPEMNFFRNHSMKYLNENFEEE